MTPILNLHDIDVTKFLAVLDTCEGNVYLVTSEGDRLNLKSKLCQLVGLTKLIEGGRIAEASIICDNKNDESKLFRFNFFDISNMKFTEMTAANYTNFYFCHLLILDGSAWIITLLRFGNKSFMCKKILLSSIVTTSWTSSKEYIFLKEQLRDILSFPAEFMTFISP